MPLSYEVCTGLLWHAALHKVGHSHLVPSLSSVYCFVRQSLCAYRKLYAILRHASAECCRQLCLKLITNLGFMCILNRCVANPPSSACNTPQGTPRVAGQLRHLRLLCNRIHNMAEVMERATLGLLIFLVTALLQTC